ncbi:MAG: hypothetical protein M1828_002236 [Chrysothrix sp. TS-e1954]|nr:MAG: hypothetical protein M1828_002236 [Chrysothrix sp. TS-e1954]
MKATQTLLGRLRRYALTTKKGPPDFYKGNRTGRMGDHTKHGGYIVNYDRVRSYVVPDLKGFKLTPFITQKVKPMRGQYGGDPRGSPLSGHYYLGRWKQENGED